jgi:hypothetical protein
MSDQINYDPGNQSEMTIDYFCVDDQIADLEYSEQMYSDIEFYDAMGRDQAGRETHESERK